MKKSMEGSLNRKGRPWGAAFACNLPLLVMRRVAGLLSRPFPESFYSAYRIAMRVGPPLQFCYSPCSCPFRWSKGRGRFLVNASADTTCVATHGMCPPDVDLEYVVQTLNQAGFANESICLLLAAGHPLARLMRDLRLLSSEADHASSGLMQWLLRLGAVVIPRDGFFIRSRHFLHCLMVEPKTSSCQGIAATLLNLCIPETEVVHLEELISDSGALVYVKCEQFAQSQWAREILRQSGAVETRCLEELPLAQESLLPKVSRRPVSLRSHRVARPLAFQRRESAGTG